MGCLEEWERRNETSFTATMMWSRAERQQKVIDSRWKWFERKSCMSSSLWRWIQRESEPLTKLKIVVILYTIVGRLMSFQSSWSPETFAAVFNFPLFLGEIAIRYFGVIEKLCNFPLEWNFHHRTMKRSNVNIYRISCWIAEAKKFRSRICFFTAARFHRRKFFSVCFTNKWLMGISWALFVPA